MAHVPVILAKRGAHVLHACTQRFDTAFAFAGAAFGASGGGAGAAFGAPTAFGGGTGAAIGAPTALGGGADAALAPAHRASPASGRQ